MILVTRLVSINWRGYVSWWSIFVDILKLERNYFSLVELYRPLIKLKETGPREIQQQSNMVLSLLGCPPPYKGRGLRILSIDGGGTRYEN